MRWQKGLWALSLGLLSPLTVSGEPVPSQNNKAETIHRDVVVIGGGSSGTYSAIRLQAMGKSVALIEKEDRLGGHVNTYVDPATQKTFDYGVIVLVNISVVNDYFNHLNVPLGKFSSFVANETTSYADFARGAAVPDTVMAKNGNITEEIVAYRELLLKYPYLSSGFHLPNPVPEELLMPYGDLMKKYNLGAVAYQGFYIDEGAGNVLAQPALYMLKYFNLLQTDGIISGLVTEANHNNQAIYDAALKTLGDGKNAFLCSQATRIVRSHKGVEVHVSTPQGRKIIKASQLIMAIPPKVNTLRPFLDLTHEEARVFRQFNNSYMWNGIVANSGIPINVGVENVDPNATFGIPPMPAAYAFSPSGVSEVHAVWYGSIEPMSEEEVKANILASLSRVQHATQYKSPKGTKPEIVQFNDHSPYELTVSVDAIKNGFYNQANALQGQTNTWWTGAAWESHDSSAIWNFTEYEILPRVLKSLR